MVREVRDAAWYLLMQTTSERRSRGAWCDRAMRLYRNAAAPQHATLSIFTRLVRRALWQSAARHEFLELVDQLQGQPGVAASHVRTSLLMALRVATLDEVFTLVRDMDPFPIREVRHAPSSF